MVSGSGFTHRLASDAWQDEEETGEQHQEHQDNGEQGAAEDEGGPL